VKTALAGGDPNWGRVLAAAGRAGVELDQARLSLDIANPGQQRLQLVKDGSPTTYSEAVATAIFARPEILIYLDLGQGPAEDTMWTTDLTHDYVTINADYRT
jgi:glutamate N-acetyltransferase/amino-acid N-acetyltransferase